MSRGVCVAARGTRGQSIALVAALAATLSGLSVVNAPIAQAAVAAKIAPAAAQVGTGVTVTGEGLAETSAVTFLGADGPADDVVAPNFVVLDNKKVMVQVPPGVET